MSRVLQFGLWVFILGAGFMLAAGNDPPSGKWRAKLLDDGSTVKLTLEVREDGNRWSFARRVPVVELVGFDERRFKRTGAEIELTWPRESGTVRLIGKGGWLLRPSGSFTFEPDPEFVARLEASGYRFESPGELLTLAVHDIDPALIEGVLELGYRRVGLGEFASLAAHDVDLAYLTAAQALGELPTFDEVRRLRVHGVPAETIAAFEAAGLTPLGVEELLRLGVHGVGPNYMAGIGAAGLGTDLDTVLSLHVHGVELPAVQGYAAEGIDGVEELLRLHVHGMAPREIAELREAGLDDLSAEELLRLHVHGIDAGFVTRVHEAGWTAPSVDELIDAHTRGIAGFLAGRGER